MSKKGIIYKITNPNSKIYIGQTTKLLKRKGAYKRLDSCIQNQIILYRSLKKYGWDAHSFEIIESCDFEKLNERERYWQEFYDVLGENGLNCRLTETNSLKRVSTIELSINLAKADENLLKVYLEIWNLYISGKNTTYIKNLYPDIDNKVVWKIKSGTHWFNKYLEEKYNIFYNDYKHLIPLNRFSSEQKAEILRLYYKEDYTVKQISKMLNCNFLTIYKILKIDKRKPSKKPNIIIQLDLNNNFIKEWTSAKEIENTLKFSRNSINAACNGNLKTYKKYKWKYKK